MNALLSIDYTVDFVADTGRLTTGQAGQAIETTLVDHTQRFIDQGILLSLPLIAMKQKILIIQKISCFLLIIWQGQRDGISTGH